MATFLNTGALTDAKRDMWKKIMTKEFIYLARSGEEVVN